MGPILYLLYASRNVVKKHLPEVQGYTDDTQLYLSFRLASCMSRDDAVKVSGRLNFGCQGVDGLSSVETQ